MAPQGDGASLRTHLRRLYKSNRIYNPLLDNKCPPGCEGVWDIYSTMGRPDGSNFVYLTQQEIAFWQINNGVKLTPWELTCIQTLDTLAGSVHKRFRVQSNNPGRPQ